MATYACSDFHGYYEVYEKIKNILKPEDVIYFLGDACDRGPQSWQTVKAVYDDPQFIFIKGNHEDMLVRAAKDYLKYDDWQYHSFNLCYRNGGKDVMMDWENDIYRETWIRRLDELPTMKTYTNEWGMTFILCHAGFTPWLDANDKDLASVTDYELIWDRDHYWTEWSDCDMADVIVVHGHTPIECLAEDIREVPSEGAFWYCERHKIDIDAGGFYANKWILLNLDTLEETIITVDDFKEYF